MDITLGGAFPSQTVEKEEKRVEVVTPTELISEFSVLQTQNQTMK
jgi:hypothetical protein